MLRNMTGVYLRRGDELLLLYRQGGRVVSDTYVASAGGHFEPDELNDPRRCVLRELNEELGLTEADLDGLRLRYIGLRFFKGEVRQNYYFFADLKEGRPADLRSNEGTCRWVRLDQLKDYVMPATARAVIDHWVETGRHDDKLYAAVSGGAAFTILELGEG